MLNICTAPNQDISILTILNIYWETDCQHCTKDNVTKFLFLGRTKSMAPYR